MSVNVDNPDAIKESLLELEWTRETLRDRFLQVLNETQVTEDAGVIVPQFIHAVATKDGIYAWTELPVSDLAESVYKPRLDAAAAILREQFHVEQSVVERPTHAMTTHRIAIKHEYDRPV